MQWKNGEALDAHLIEQCLKPGEELSDILYWTLLMAHDLGINLTSAFAAKMLVNETKYPIEHSQGPSKK
jgi:NTP pyrophosphatase (non-canonical NTP hydrolase)